MAQQCAAWWLPGVADSFVSAPYCRFHSNVGSPMSVPFQCRFHRIRGRAAAAAVAVAARPCWSRSTLPYADAGWSSCGGRLSTCECRFHSPVGSPLWCRFHFGCRLHPVRVSMRGCLGRRCSRMRALTSRCRRSTSPASSRTPVVGLLFIGSMSGASLRELPRRVDECVESPREHALQRPRNACAAHGERHSLRPRDWACGARRAFARRLPIGEPSWQRVKLYARACHHVRLIPQLTHSCWSCVARCQALRDLLKVVRLLHTSIHTIICEHN